MNFSPFTYISVFILSFDSNHISGVMVSVFASSARDRGFEPRSGQTKDYKIGIVLLRFAHSIKEKEQRLVGSQSG